MQVVCPYCGSRHLRYAHRRDLSERLWSLVGVRPLRCRDCRKRFVDRTWRFSSLKYSRCPNCWRMDLNTWSPEDHHAKGWQLLLLRLGGRPYRCEYCRLNFVSFRPRLERFSFRNWKKRERHTEAAEEVVGGAAAGASGEEASVGASAGEAARAPAEAEPQK